MAKHEQLQSPPFARSGAACIHLAPASGAHLEGSEASALSSALEACDVGVVCKPAQSGSAADASTVSWLLGAQVQGSVLTGSTHSCTCEQAVRLTDCMSPSSARAEQQLALCEWPASGQQRVAHLDS